MPEEKNEGCGHVTVSASNDIDKGAVVGHVPHFPAVAIDPMFQIVREAMNNPDFDVAKMREVLSLMDERKERDLQQEAEAAFNAAMSQVQSKMRRVVADKKNSQTTSEYASLGAIDRMLRPLYTEAGFALSFNTEEGAPAEVIRIVCFVTHTAPGAKRSHTRPYRLDMPADGKGPKGNDVMTKTHAAGSGLSYGQRYLERMIFNIAVGKDDDGNAASAAVDQPKMTPEDLAIITKAISDTKTDLAPFLEFLQADSLETLNLTQWQIAMSWLARKADMAKKKAEKPAQ